MSNAEYTNKHIVVAENLNRLIRDGLIEADALSPSWLENRGLEIRGGLVRDAMFGSEQCYICGCIEYVEDLKAMDLISEDPENPIVNELVCNDCRIKMKDDE